MAEPVHGGTNVEQCPALEMALALLEAGWWPIPIRPAEVGFINSGKRPLYNGWGKDRPTVASLTAAYSRDPQAGVGVLLGPVGGLVDIDVDDIELARPMLKRMFPDGDPPTWGWRSTGQRWHRMFCYDERLARYGKAIIKGWLKDGEVCGNPHYLGLEIRTGYSPDGKQYQTVVPPSLCSDGQPRVSNGIMDVLPLPESVFADLDRYASAEATQPPLKVVSSLGGFDLPRRQASHDLDLRVRAYLSSVPPAVSGQGGHAQTFKTACAVGPGFDLPPSVALGHMREWNQTCQPPWNDKELEHKVMEAYKVEPRRGWLVNQEQPARNGRQPAKPKQPEPDDTTPIIDTWPDPPDDIAFHGLAGEIARTVEPTSEADPIAVLMQVLVGFGNLIGRTAYFVAESDQHYCNEFAILVGRTSKGRKGSSWSQAKRFLIKADHDWAVHRTFNGLSSGEGLINAVRDKLMRREPIKERGRVTGYQEVEADPGVDDKRAMVVETEFGGTLKVAMREGSTLSAILRKAWDQGELRTLTKNSPLRATNAHISIIGHVTDAELRRHMAEVDAANGFANRFLWLCVQRSKSLPFGGGLEQTVVDSLRARLQQAAGYARDQEQMQRDEAADALWGERYEHLSEGHPGLLGAILGRAEAHVMRLALIYALLDCSPAIGQYHLKAAMALWEYCEKSASHIFGDDLGDGDADKLLSALREAPQGLTRTQITVDVFRRNRPTKTIREILGRLLGHRLISQEIIHTEGAVRPTEVWHFGRGGDKVR